MYIKLKNLTCSIIKLNNNKAYVDDKVKLKIVHGCYLKEKILNHYMIVFMLQENIQIIQMIIGMI